MRALRFLLALACLFAGAVLGALNRQHVVVDLGVSQVASSLGVVMLCCLLAGLLFGGLAATATRAISSRARLRSAQSAGPATPGRDAT